jgi:formylglycine-generating enzyme required for sulfatase activity
MLIKNYPSRHSRFSERAPFEMNLIINRQVNSDKLQNKYEPMKRFVFLVTLAAIILTGCGRAPSGELVGVQGRKKWHEPDPYGMVFVPQGSFIMGPSDEDVMFAQNAFARTVSVDAFWMDETEITNNKYRQFVYYVRDSIMRRKLGDVLDEFLITEDEFDRELDQPRLNWRTRIDMRNEEINEIVEQMYYPVEERFWGRKELDTRQLNFEYFWVDYEQASRRSNRWNPQTQQYEGTVFNQNGEEVPIVNRSSFVLRDAVNVYPDTLVWIHDFTYSYNEPMANMYFWHPSYDNYPVVGVNWKQAMAFGIWRTKYLNEHLAKRGQGFVQNYRLPWNLNGNMQPAEAFLCRCIPGEGRIPGIWKAASWQTLNPCGVIIQMTDGFILRLLLLLSQMITGSMIWPATWPNGRRMHMTSRSIPLPMT